MVINVREQFASSGHLALAALVVGGVAALTTLLQSSAYPSLTNNDQAQSVGPWTVDFSTAAATAHLLKIAATEHALPSAANWDVRQYLLDQAQALASSAQGITRGVQVESPANQSAWVAFKAQNEVSFSSFAVGAPQFIESSNVYIRIPGINEKATGDRSAVLLSAHFDSVPTAKGVGDDSMAIAALLEIARIAIQQPLTYSLVFNLNNGEELGLYGALAMVRHPWWKDVAAFINADSVCPTGRPLLYRSTSRELVSIYKQNVAYPHASVIGQEAMAAGLIHSDTDYSVYSAYNVTGIDFAFYDHRAVYHTDLDAMNLYKPESMAHLGNDILGVLAGINATGVDHVRTAPETKNVAFMDFAGRSMLVATYSSLFAIGLGTTLVAVLGGIAVWFLRRRHHTRMAFSTLTNGEPHHQYGLGKAMLFMLGALLATILVPFGCLTVAFAIQPFAPSGRPILVLVTAVVAALLASAGVAWLGVRFSAMITGVPAHLGLAVVWTGVLALATAGAYSTGFVMQMYWYAALYPLLAFAGYAWIGHQSEATRHSIDSVEKADDDEHQDATNYRGHTRTNLLLTAHFVLATSWPAVVSVNNAVIYIYALAFNVQEGMSAVLIAAFAAIMAFPVALNATPLLMGAGKRVSGVVAVALAAATVACVLWLALAFPFTPTEPNKLYYSYRRAINATVPFSSVTSVTDSVAVPLTQSMAPTVRIASSALGSGVVDALGTAFPGIACNITSNACTMPPSVLGVDTVMPNATWTMRAPTAAARANGTAAELELSVPASMLSCFSYVTGPTSATATTGQVGGGYVALVPNKQQLQDPAPMVTVDGSAIEFGVVASNPTTPLVVRVGVPAAMVAPGAPAWDLQCVVAVNDGPVADGQDRRGDYLAVYKKVLAKLPEWVAITRGSIDGLAGTIVTVSFKP
ncbi:hypothetical protein BC828DRAFT_399919 [Blastocladiella britannica]|nr:hypothetical protein BC828DRAFT_399919 [Blastocladiella britannica]